MSGPEFKVGDRVRLKAKPDVVGVIKRLDSTQECGPVYFHPDRGGQSIHRYPEELEAAPHPPEWYVGKTIRHVIDGADSRRQYLVVGYDPEFEKLVVRTLWPASGSYIDFAPRNIAGVVE